MTFDLSVIDFIDVIVFAIDWNERSRFVSLSFPRFSSLEKLYPSVRKRFLGNFNIVASQNSFHVFGNSTNVRDNLKTSTRYLAHRSVTQRRNWFATVKKERFSVAVVLKDSERMLALLFLRIVGGWKTLGPREQGSSYGLFIAIRMVRVESEIFVGVCGFAVYTCFLISPVPFMNI